MSMHRIDLTRVDLNLLVVFEALESERHVGRAAARLSLSQSATSHALGRLRALFDDPLFVRHPRGVEPTPRASELAPAIGEVLDRLRHIVRGPAAFDPATLRRTFTVATHDYALAVLLPGLLADLRAQAPGVDVRFVSVPPDRVVDGLDHGHFDFALGGFVGIAAHRIARTELFTDRFVGVARRGHQLLAADDVSMDDFLRVPQVLVSPDGRPRGDIDDALSTLGVARRIAVTVPTFLALPQVVEHTDIVGVLPRRLAMRSAEIHDLEVFELPLDVEPVTCSMLYPTPLAALPEISWLTALLVASAGE